MKNAFAALAGLSMFALAATANAGPPVQLSDAQMDAVTAGSALAITAFQTSLAGQQTAIQTNLGNTAVELGDASLAQSRAAVLGTAVGNASIATNVFNQAVADSQNSSRSATASTAGLARGDMAVLQSVGVTTAFSATRPGYGSMGVAASLANVTSFSASGKLH